MSDSFAFLLDMNRLFEDFVTRVLVDVLAPTRGCSPTAGPGSDAHHGARTGRPYAAVIPDILLEQYGAASAAGARRCQVQALRRAEVDPADVYQTFFYAWAYASQLDQADAPSFILYPGHPGSSGTHLKAQARVGERAATIRAIPIDVPGLLAQVRAHQPVELAGLRQAILG